MLGSIARSPKFWVLMGATAAAAGSGVSWLSRRVRPGLIDWEMAQAVALWFTSRPGDPDGLPYPDADYTEMVESSRNAVSEYLGREASDKRAGVEVLDRKSWVEVNILNFKKMFKPVEESYQRLHTKGAGAGRLMSGLTGLAVSVQMGVMIGFLSRRVLGQYDIPLLEPGEGSIYLVDVNINSLAKKIGVKPDDLRRWVALHETTHAVEFESTPWLRDYMAGLLGEYLAEAGETILNPSRLRERIASMSSGRSKGLRLNGVLRLMLSDKQAQIISQIQALMSVMEGYSNHAMHNTGQDLIPNYRILAARMKVREKSRGFAFRVISRLLGLDMKLEQYIIGESFINHVIGSNGVQFANKVWESPDQIPSLEEVREPDRWISRIEGESA